MSQHADKPSWLVDDLGPKGADFVDITSFAPPPEESHGALFLPDRLEKGYHVEEIRDGVYWVTVGWYDCLFVRPHSIETSGTHSGSAWRTFWSSLKK